MLVELPHPGVVVRARGSRRGRRSREHLPGLLVEHVALGDVELGGLEEVAPRAELELRARRVPVADGPRVAVAAEVVELVAAPGTAPSRS